MDIPLPHRAIAAAMAATLALTIASCAAPPSSERVSEAAGAPLVNTNWRLTKLGEQLVGNTMGAGAVNLQLQPQNPRVTGFGGCNRMFGGYVLNGDQLKFDQVGATKMACLDEGRMKLEQDYFQMLSTVSAWKISGNSLIFLDGGGASVATFVASAPE